MTSGKKILSLYAVNKKPKVRLWRVKLRIFPYFFLTQTLIKSFAITSKLKLQFSFLGNGKCLCNLLRERKREWEEKGREILHLKIHSIWKNNKRGYCSFIQKGQETWSWNTESRTIEPGGQIWLALALPRLLSYPKIYFSFSQWAISIWLKTRAQLERSRAVVNVNTMRSSTNKKALERTYTSQCQGLFCLDFRQYTRLPVVSDDGTYSFMEFTSTKFSTTLKNINKIWLYCFVNRADTLYRYWCSSTFKNILNPLCLCTTRAIIHKYRCRSPLNCCYSNNFWALSYRQHVHPKDPTEYILWQHLGFCTVKTK